MKRALKESLRRLRLPYVDSFLLHTPLTDKCYLTLTQAMHMGFGGNLHGPSGTGKTESVKALGAAFGRQVLVFNFDERIDSKSMGRIFFGLVKCGAWGCFDEFNRLLPDQVRGSSWQIPGNLPGKFLDIFRQDA